MHEVASRCFSRLSVPKRPVSNPARNPAAPMMANSKPTVADPPCSSRSTMNGTATVKMPPQALKTVMVPASIRSTRLRHT